MLYHGLQAWVVMLFRPLRFLFCAHALFAHALRKLACGSNMRPHERIRHMHLAENFVIFDEIPQADQLSAGNTGHPGYYKCPVKPATCNVRYQCC